MSNQVLEKIRDIQKELNNLEIKNDLCQAQRVIASIIKLLDDSISIDDQSLFQLFTDSDGKIRANASWFYEDSVMTDRKATYKVYLNNNLNLDIKLYGITKPSKRTIAWVQALTPNFEDEPFNKNFNVGIDFIVPKNADRVVVVLSNNWIVRTLELKGNLTATYQEILARWTEIKNFDNKTELHKILWESFDIQPLNKKFYAGISERFTLLRQYLVKEKIFDEKHASLFANRLIGRVIFCWFLDKKGIINSDQKYFDSESFDDDTEYYKEKLEKLFFEVLNTPIGDREFNDGATPFLNGGLFEARKNDLCNDSRLSFPKNYFDDLFEFLSSYNFTTDESTSQFQQVAIDPEMLGHIFENLLSEMTEETGEQARKAKGAFYTPREIVDYMCKESLKEYLKTKIEKDENLEQRLYQLIDAPDKDFQDQDHNWRRDWKPYKEDIIKALDELKVLDPACGSGAFPIGMLQLLVRVYERLEARFDSYKTKLGIIEKNIYGVDIEPMAVEIARLRAWLSIIVDEESDSKKIKPLPNLEFKFICANSLISAPEQDGDENRLFGDDFQKKLAVAVDRYFSSTGMNKISAGNEIHKLIDRKVEEKLKHLENLVFYNGDKKMEALRAKTNKKEIGKHSRILNLWGSYKNIFKNEPVGFFDTKYFFPSVKDGFDMIIGNPPYIKEYTNKSAFDDLRKSPHYQGKMDIWYFFSCRFLDLLKEKGIECFIAQNNWVTSSGASKMRNKIIKDAKILKLIDFGNYKIFETAGIQTMIMFFIKYSESTKYNFDYRKITTSKPNFSDVMAVLEKSNKEGILYLNPEIKRLSFADSNLVFSSSELESILDNIQKKKNFILDAKNEVAQGIVYPQDKLNKKSKNILGNDFAIGDGIFVLNQQEKDSLSLTQKELKIIKPTYTTSELKKWYGSSSNKEWTIYTDSRFKNQVKINEFPNIKEHLDKFKKVITSDNKPYGLHRVRNENFFRGEKVIVARKCTSPSFTYTDFDAYVSATFYIIKTNRVNQKYLTAILNSKIVAFWLKYKGKMQGNNYQIDKEPILEIPIAVADVSKQKQIVSLVDQIIESKKKSIDYNVSDLEQKIDDLVMNLYQLSEEEKKLIEDDLSFKL